MLSSGNGGGGQAQVRAGDSSMTARVPLPNERAKVLVLGESGVGKSTLVHRLCHGMNDTDRPTQLTTGCRVDVAFLKDGGAGGQPALIDLWDVSGLQAYAASRSVFYRDYDGIIMVHDLTNSKVHSIQLRHHCRLLYLSCLCVCSFVW